MILKLSFRVLNTFEINTKACSNKIAAGVLHEAEKLFGNAESNRRAKAKRSDSAEVSRPKGAGL